MKKMVFNGGPGSGKTRVLMNVMDRHVKAPGDIADIAFVSFTRAAVYEALRRLKDRFDNGMEEGLRTEGFRTIHSHCHKLMQTDFGGEFRLMTREAEKAFCMAYGYPKSSYTETEEDPDTYFPSFEVKLLGDFLFLIHNISNATMQPPGFVRKRIVVPAKFENDITSDTLDLFEQRYAAFKAGKGSEGYTEIITAYRERAAGYNGRAQPMVYRGPMVDYDDLIAHALQTGTTPVFSKWFVDEFQDLSPAMYRLICKWTENAEYVYYAGDAFQSIFEFAGAQPRLLLNELYSSPHEILNVSYRCRSRILDFSRYILQQMPEYDSRLDMIPVEEGGSVTGIADCEIEDTVEAYASAGRKVFVLTRMLYQASQLILQFNRDLLPHTILAGGFGQGIWHTRVPHILAAAKAITRETRLTKDEVVALFRDMPVSDRHGKGGIIRWGEKEKLIRGEYEFMEVAEILDRCVIGEPVPLLNAIDGVLLSEPENTGNHCAGEVLGTALRKGSFELKWDPRNVTVGTIHRAKGLEADVVIMVCGVSGKMWEAAETDPLVREAEGRVYYVGATRARDVLCVVNPWANEYVTNAFGALVAEDARKRSRAAAPVYKGAGL